MADAEQVPTGEPVVRRPGRPNYGIDSPPIVISLAALGVFALLLGLFLVGGNKGDAAAGLGPFLFAAILLFGAALMVRSSLVGKPRLVQRELDALALAGDERALDAGCGRGLGLVELARRLPDGHVDGVDLWRGRDQSGNSRTACELTLRIAAVEERVAVHDGDLRELPFADRSFDVVTSTLALHHLPLAADRGKAVQELMRVLRPGGQLLIIDNGKTGEYLAWLEDAGFTDVSRRGPSFATWPVSYVVRARRPAKGGQPRTEAKRRSRSERKGRGAAADESPGTA